MPLFDSLSSMGSSGALSTWLAEPTPSSTGLRSEVIGTAAFVMHPPVASGLPPTACGMYQQEADWLPEAYVHNATCACSTLPNEPHANCIRSFLQQRLSAYPEALKNTLRAAKQSIIPGHYEYAVQTALTPRIYGDHTAAYQACGCKGHPAPYPDWIGVTTIPLPCPAVHRSILLFGPCSGTPNKW